MLRVPALCLVFWWSAAATTNAPALAKKEAAPVEVPKHAAYFPDLIYAAPPEGDELRLDLAVPKAGKGPFPVVLLIHGGGWFSGTRKTYAYMLWQLTERGYAAASISFRFAKFPMPVEDAQAAVHWLRANAAKYNLDPRRIAAWGYSSGGQQACLLGMGSGEKPRNIEKVQCVVCYYGITDLQRLHADCCQGNLSPLYSKFVQHSLEMLLGGSPETVPAQYAAASPAFRISSDTSPILLVHGAKDSVVPLDQSRHFYKRLRVWRVPAQLICVEDAPHNFIGTTEKKANAMALDFLDKHMSVREGPEPANLSK